ncbi:16S rRNA (guanine(966)-N(2))-methyltransferase RsmD [Candidatus Stoquefichus massiliensis]|uniref:16S rRNA (guanine(966)-N(2))-methyltransferase RsmD n=1 Tax=Candidatus Stoquefichus massiliensis TaxID=1470350 RepID=UPI00048337A5|nr:16S rRNA (guanine(966)-N(2))-methyltransferase RsmD [Candidatus Stoquefichus massiliensis]
MRVVAGKYRSRQLKSVDSHLTRSTTDKNKENLFNMIGPYFDGGVCLDLFSGSGGLGIEALSRGIDKLYCVDKQYKAFATIKENIKSLKIEDVTEVYKMDYQKALQLFAQENLKFDLVFLDPPYGMKINQEIIQYMAHHHMLQNNCVIIIEDLIEEVIEIKTPFVLKKQQSYGITTLQIIEYKE